MRRRSDAAAAAAAAAAPDTTQTGMRSVTLWFGATDGDSLVAEVRELAEQADLHARVAQLVAALDQGPLRRGVAVVPTGTSVLHVYLDDRGLLTLDLSRAFQQGFRGGSRAEDLVVARSCGRSATTCPRSADPRSRAGARPLVIAGRPPPARPAHRRARDGD